MLQNNQLSMELLALLSMYLFPFLVGPCTTDTWQRDDGEAWKSKVVIEKCKFLEASGCKGMCVGLCKKPSEAYFASIGLPVSFTPDFETGGCEMVWGRTPRDSDMDDADMTCFRTCSLLGAPRAARADGDASARSNSADEASGSADGALLLATRDTTRSADVDAVPATRRDSPPRFRIRFVV